MWAFFIAQQLGGGEHAASGGDHVVAKAPWLAAVLRSLTTPRAARGLAAMLLYAIGARAYALVSALRPAFTTDERGGSGSVEHLQDIHDVLVVHTPWLFVDLVRRRGGSRALLAVCCPRRAESSADHRRRAPAVTVAPPRCGTLDRPKWLLASSRGRARFLARGEAPDHGYDSHRSTPPFSPPGALSVPTHPTLRSPFPAPTARRTVLSIRRSVSGRSSSSAAASRAACSAGPPSSTSPARGATTPITCARTRCAEIERCHCLSHKVHPQSARKSSARVASRHTHESHRRRDDRDRARPCAQAARRASALLRRRAPRAPRRRSLPSLVLVVPPRRRGDGARDDAAARRARRARESVVLVARGGERRWRAARAVRRRQCVSRTLDLVSTQRRDRLRHQSWRRARYIVNARTVRSFSPRDLLSGLGCRDRTRCPRFSRG